MKNPINSVGRLFANIRTTIKESNRKTRIEAIRKSFYTEEKNGSMWIMHNGTAIDVITGENETAQDIVDRLNECREAAIKFEYEMNT